MPNPRIVTGASPAAPRRVIQWSDDLAVGIPQVDTAHKTIINQLNELHKLLFDPTHALGTKQTIMRKLQVTNQAKMLLAFLESYSIEHFAQEETIMACHSCTFRHKHTEAHQAMRKLLDGWTVELHQDVQNDTNERMCAVVTEFSDWFERHLRTADCKLKGIKTNWIKG